MVGDPPLGQHSDGVSVKSSLTRPDARWDSWYKTSSICWLVVIGLGLVAGLAFLRAPFTRVPDALFVSDGFGYYVYLPSIVIDGDLDLSNQVRRLPYEGGKAFFKVSEATGRTTDQFPIGCALMWTPFFLGADLVVRSLRASGLDVARTGFGYAYELPVYLGSFLYGVLGLLLTRRTLLRFFEQKVSDLSLVAMALATPTGYYLAIEPNMSHSVAYFLVALWFDVLSRLDHQRDTRISPWVTLGITLGLIALIRPYNAVLGVTAIPTAFRVSERASRFVGAIWKLLVVLLVTILVMVPQFWVWKTLYGTWLVVPKGSGYEQIRWSWSSLASFVTSIFALWPIYLPAGLGLILGSLDSFRSQSASGRSQFFDTCAPFMLAVLVVLTFLVANSRDWMLGTAFGQRRMVDWTPFFAMGLAKVMDRASRASEALPRFLVGGVGGLVVLNGILVVLYLLRTLPEYGRVI